MKCAICGKEKMLVYASMYLETGACMECYDEAKRICKHMEEVLPVSSEAGVYTVRRLDAFGHEIYRKQYKTKRFMKFIQDKTKQTFFVNED